MGTGQQVVFWISSGSFEPRLRLGLWAVTAASVGESVHILLTGEALHRWCEGTFDEVDEQGGSVKVRAVELGLPAITALIAQARELSSLRVVSCSTEIALAGLDESDVRHRLDEVVSLPSFWRETATARLVSLTG